MTSGYVVSSASWFDSGYMLLPVYGFFGVLFPYSAQCLVLSGPRCAPVTELRRRFPCRGAEAESHGLAVQQTIVIRQSLFHKVIDVPGVKVCELVGPCAHAQGQD